MSLRRAITAYIAACIAASAAPAQIPNGNFETGTLSGWTVELANHGQFQPCGALDFTGPGNPPVPGISLFTASTVLPSVDMSLIPNPYEGSYMALLNDPVGGYHACRLSRTFTMTSGDLAVGGLLGLEWGAVLEDPGHTNGCQPFFHLEVSSSCGVSQQLSVDATDAASQGWLNVALSSTGNPFYYKHDVWCVDLSACPPGTAVTVRIAVADCGLSAHGGFAFLDRVRFLTCTPTPSGMVAWWDDDSGEDIALANDYVKHGFWVGSPGSGKVGSESALHFGGSNYGEVGCHTPSFHFAPNQGFAIDMWVRPQTGIPFFAPLVNKFWVHAGIFWAHVYDFHLEDRYLALTLKSGSSGGAFSNYVCTDARVPLGEWTHIAVSADRAAAMSEIRFYINGERRDVFSSTAGLNQNGALEPQIFYIGRSTLNYSALPTPNQTDSFFRGRMDEIEVFNRALTDAEVYAIFRSGCRGKCKPAGPIDWLQSLPALPAFPPGTIGTTVSASACCKLVALTGAQGPVSTTSTWDGIAWTSTSGAGPSGITGAMCFDSARGVAVLLGGNAALRAAEVWEWSPGASGGTWSRILAPNGPGDLSGHAVAFDSLRTRTVLFGGADGAGARTTDTWTWNGSAWQRSSTAVAPAARTEHAMAFDATRGQVVLFGGSSASGRSFGDTWLFDGATWSMALPAFQPPARRGHAMAFDPARGRVVLYGGNDGLADLGDTWEWDGATWSQTATTNAPDARRDALLAFDEASQKLVLTGGTAPADGMWYYGSTHPATARTFGAGCPGIQTLAVPRLELEGQAWLGATHVLATSAPPPANLATCLLGLSNASSPLGPLPLNLAFLGLHPSCELRVDPAFSFTLPLASGAARLPLALPNDPLLLALVYYAQALAFATGSAEIALSNAVEVSIGRF